MSGASFPSLISTLLIYFLVSFPFTSSFACVSPSSSLTHFLLYFLIFYHLFPSTSPPSFLWSDYSVVYFLYFCALISFISSSPLSHRLSPVYSFLLFALFLVCCLLFISTSYFTSSFPLTCIQLPLWFLNGSPFLFPSTSLSSFFTPPFLFLFLLTHSCCIFSSVFPFSPFLYFSFPPLHPSVHSSLFYSLISTPFSFFLFSFIFILQPLLFLLHSLHSSSFNSLFPEKQVSGGGGG